MLNQNLPFDLSGDWFFTGRPLEKPTRRFGHIRLQLQQHGTEISGAMWQVQSPNQELPTPEDQDPQMNLARVSGQITLSPTGEGHLLTIKRLEENGPFVAIFTGTYDAQNEVIDGWFVNNLPGRGVCRIARVPWPEIPIQTLVERLPVNEKSADEATILQMADDFEAGFSARDAAKILALFLNDDAPFVGPKTETSLNNQSIGAFICAAVAREQLVEEKLFNREIMVRGSTAVLLCDYVYLVGGAEKGRGRETWSLIKTARGWKIIAATFLDGAAL